MKVPSYLDFATLQHRVFDSPWSSRASVSLMPFTLVTENSEFHQRAAAQLSEAAQASSENLSTDTPAVQRYLPIKSRFDKRRIKQAYDRLGYIADKMRRDGDIIAAVVEVADPSGERQVVGVATQYAVLPETVEAVSVLPADTRTPVINTGYWLDERLKQKSQLDGLQTDRLLVGSHTARLVAQQALTGLVEVARPVLTPYAFLRDKDPSNDVCYDLARTGIFVPTQTTGRFNMSGLNPNEDYRLYVLDPNVTAPEQI